MIYKLDKVSFNFLSRIRDIRQIMPGFANKSHFVRSSVIFLPFFSHKVKNQLFVQYSTYGCRNFDGEIFGKKLMMFVDIHNKYLELTLITYENIQKVNHDIFFELTVATCVI